MRPSFKEKDRDRERCEYHKKDKKKNTPYTKDVKLDGKAHLEILFTSECMCRADVFPYLPSQRSEKD